LEASRIYNAVNMRMRAETDHLNAESLSVTLGSPNRMAHYSELNND